MGVDKKVLKDGDGKTYPTAGDTVAIEYTGWLYEPSSSQTDYKGKEFDASAKRGEPLVTKIGVGAVIRGWDEGVLNMSLGEKSTLIISSDYAYGPKGFPGAIPPNSSLVFDVELKNVKPK